jgi:glucan biosynthesis protein C
MPIPATDASERLHGLDALRGGALLLGVVLHAALAYFPTPVWLVTDAATSPIAAVLFFAIHVFRMATLFLLAGLFAHLMLQRRGTAGFIRDRLLRIAGPLLAFWWPVLAAIVAVIVWNAWIQTGGQLPSEAPPGPAFTPDDFPLTHLWFLWVLLLFYAGLLLVRLPLSRWDRNGAWTRRGERLVGALIGPWGPIVLAVPLAVALYATPNWIVFFGIPTPDQALIPNRAALTGFGVAFGFGFLLARRREWLAAIATRWPLYLAVAATAITTALLLAGGPGPRLAPLTAPVAKATAAAVYALAVYASTFAAVALALRFAAGHSALRRYLADAAYWIYIVHLPLVMAGQVLVQGLAWPWWLKLGAVVAGAAGVALASYALLIRHGVMGRWLNGRRIPRRTGSADAADAPIVDSLRDRSAAPAVPLPGRR